MKKLICIFLFIALLFSGCLPKGELVQKGKAYNIYQKGEKYYMRVNAGYTTGYAAPIDYSAYVHFDSFEEMKVKVLSGDFTYDETKYISQYAKSVHEAEMVNPFRLYELYAPGQYEMAEPIAFNGNEYELEYREENNKDHSLITGRIVTPDRYSELVAMYNSSYKTDFNGENRTVIKDETDPVSEKRSVLYTHGNIRYFVEYVRYITPEREQYAKVTRQLDKDWKMLDTGSIRIYGKENGGYFDIHIFNAVISEPVDIQYISQFGIRPV